jgi:uncharacterized protein YndB with AHSA1/START domain
MTDTTYSVCAERILNAAPEDVFDVYTDPVAGQTIFSGGRDWLVVVTCDLHVDGLWTIVSGPPNSPPYREVNQFIEIARPTRLAFNSTLEVPGGPKIVRKVDVTFERTPGDRTFMTIAQGGFPNREYRDQFEAALSSVFDHLEALAKVRRERAQSDS